MEPRLPQRYRVLRPLGRGGQGSVYLAEDRRAGSRWVAVKVLSPLEGSLWTPGDLSREFVIQSRLAHPNIVRVLDFGLLEGGRSAYIASEHVPGPSLLEWSLELGAQEKWRALNDVLGQSLSVLHYLSIRGIEHADVKPTNLLIDTDGEGSSARPVLRLIDFGLARLKLQASAPEVAATRAYSLPPGRDFPSRDLFALGLSLFHASTGRLPFLPGDEVAHEAWLASLEPAQVRLICPDAHPAFDEIVAGLTEPRPQRGFRSALEALERLRGRVSLPPLPRPRSAEQAAFPCREEAAGRIAARVVAGGLHGLVGPTGIGKTRALEAISARLQADGWRTVTFRHPRDQQAAEQLREILGEFRPGPTGHREPKDPLELVSLPPGSHLAVLVDDDIQGTTAAGEEDDSTLIILRDLARKVDVASRRRPRTPPGLLFLGVAESPADLEKWMQVRGGALQLHPLEPLDRASVSAALSEYFCVEEAPGDLAELLERTSHGLPATLNAALEDLWRDGASVDFMGHLSVPRSFSPRPPGKAESSIRMDGLSPILRGTLGALQIFREPLGPDAAAGIFARGDAGDWQARLEDLRWRGLARLQLDPDGPKYAAVRLEDAAAVKKLLGEDEIPLRQSYSRFLETSGSASKTASSPESALAAALNDWALGNARKSCLACLAIWRRVEKLPSKVALQELSEQVLGWAATAAEAQGEIQAPARLPWILRLRRAAFLLRRGSHAQCASELEPRAGAAPAWFTEMRLDLRAQALERQGDVRGAIASLEALHEMSRPIDLRRRLLRLGAAARLARLYFAAGRGGEGLSRLLEGRELLRTPPEKNPTSGGPLLCQVYTLLASAEALHGEVKHAQSFLERAIAWARASRREELLPGPLNELGIALGQRQEWQESLAVFREIGKISEGLGDRLGVLRAIFNQAIVHYRLQQLDPAETLFRTARKLSDELGSHSLASAIWLGFASVLRERGRLLEALRLYQRVLRAQSGARPNDMAVAHNNLSDLYLSLGRIRKSALHAYLAYRIARRTGNRFLLGLSLRSRGLVRLALGKVDSSREDLSRALELARRERDARAQAESHHSLGILEALSRNPLASIRALRAAQKKASEAHDTARGAGALVALTAVLAASGRSAAAARRLATHPRTTGGWNTWELSRSVIELGLKEGSRDNWSRAIALLRKSSREGRAWEALCALTWLCGRIRAMPRAEISPRFELGELCVRMGRGLSSRARAKMHRLWLDRDSTGTERSPEVPAPPMKRDAWSEALYAGAPPTRLVQSALESIAISLEARSACVFLDPRLDSDPVIQRANDSVALDQAEVREALQEARKSHQLFHRHPYVLQRIPDPRAVRVLCLELPASRPLNPSRDLRQELESCARALAISFRLIDKEREAENLTRLHDEAKREVHSLSALVARDRQELETARINRLSEVKDSGSDRRGLAVDQRVLRQISVAASPSMKQLLERLPRISVADIPVLIIGESGVGKDWIARRIHELSRRRDRPFVSGICDIPESLMEAELFGHVEGAFTGATTPRPGVFERASGGTIHLDEISELAQGLQARLLRVLEQKEIRPLGGSTTVSVDFRLVSTSSSSLEQLRRSERFRADLLYRLQGEVIEIPPLRKRPEDIPVLVQEILREHSRVSGKPIPYLPRKAMDRLMAHAWPGNLRELENEISRVLVTHPIEILPDTLLTGHPRKGTTTESGHHPRARSNPSGSVPTLKEARDRTELETVEWALRESGGNVSHAAKALAITRRHLTTLIEKHHLLRAEYLPPPKPANPAQRVPRSEGSRTRPRKPRA